MCAATDVIALGYHHSLVSQASSACLFPLCRRRLSFFFFLLSSFLGRAVASWIDRCLTLESALLIFLIHRLVAISTLLLSVVTQILPPFKILTQRRTRCILEVDFPGSCIKAIQREDSAAPFYLFLNPITAATKVERVLSLIFSSSLYVFFFSRSSAS